MNNTHRTAQCALIVAAASAVSWAAKALIFGLTGATDSITVDVLFLFGLVSQFGALVLLMLTWTRNRGRVTRILAGVYAVPLGVALAMVTNTMIGAVEPANSHWISGELNLWLSAAAVLVAAFVTARRVVAGDQVAPESVSVAEPA